MFHLPELIFQFQDLIKGSTVFSSLMEEYGSLEGEKGRKVLGKHKAGASTIVDTLEEKANKELQAALMQAEERNIGSVSWDVYKKYLRSAGGILWAPLLIALLVLNEAAQGEGNYFDKKRRSTNLLPLQSQTTCSLVSGRETLSAGSREGST